mmetsp:Transcript_19802/g.19133  ORF Transcript_19802/g.19133 Transcript_19802/m.19133 type:complete len:378 (+) Transcript_19802:117-1250(+)|eukprot:CAMPEP_0119050952 /NCGR_PEP_ID=MMETSP1177-20130426/72729_1 /TAXON_ID=2985 /ORGANISM="Ochromonas sp, Strain CCMP1899" /LENGTH=377 /DNA_ID=CAMNT_0007029989 /DNA_START=105 /DNA_END=1238 /DNA_ORIENTATION=-
MYPSRNSLNGKGIRQIVIEEKIDDLERRLKERIEVSSGFAETLPQSRKMRQALQFFDSAGEGLLNYQGFFQAMTKFNLVGVQREVEALFNRYDDYLAGFIDYRDLALVLYGLSNGAISLDKESRAVIYKMKEMIASIGGASGLLRFIQEVKRIEGVEAGFISREDLVYTMSEFGLYITPTEYDILYEKFDIDGNSQFLVLELLRYLKSGMSLDRKQLVLTAYQRMDHTGEGVITVDAILQNFDFSFHPNVKSGLINPGQAAQEMLDSFQEGVDSEGRVSWQEFLDYFKCISLAVEDDDYFELMIRNALKPIGGGTQRFNNTHATARRVMVVHSTGKQEIIELTDDDVDVDQFGAQNVMERLKDQGIHDVIKVKILND